MLNKVSCTRLSVKIALISYWNDFSLIPLGKRTYWTRPMNLCKKFKFWKLSEHPLFDISEYAFKLNNIAWGAHKFVILKLKLSNLDWFEHISMFFGEGKSNMWRNALLCSGIASGVIRGAECHPWQRKFAKNRGKNQEKLGKKRKNREENAKIRKFLSLCPSWQIRLVTLLLLWLVFVSPMQYRSLRVQV